MSRVAALPEHSAGLSRSLLRGAGFVAWYTHMVWKYYEVHKAQQLENAGPSCLRMDASRPLEELTATALEHARQGREQMQASSPRL